MFTSSFITITRSPPSVRSTCVLSTKLNHVKQSILVTCCISTNEITSKTIYERCELYSHADTTVAGYNYIILQHTRKEYSVQPYSNVYIPTCHVPIVHAATAYQCLNTDQTHILILNECLWMGNTMEQSLINTN